MPTPNPICQAREAAIEAIANELLKVLTANNVSTTEAFEESLFEFLDRNVQLRGG